MTPWQKDSGGRAALLAIVLLGLGLRVWHYARLPAVWHDEAAVIVNVLERDYLALLGPLKFHEAAPPLFLWLERGVARTLGEGELALRLPALLASCLGLVLLVPVARRLLPARARPWAVFLFAVSEMLAWHAREAKPYAFDVLVALTLMLLYLHITPRNATRWLLASALLAPLFLWVSYPACFLLGGFLLALLPLVRPAGRPGVRLAYAALAVSTGVAFLALVLGPARAQHDSAITSCWTHCFPCWDAPLSVPLWTAVQTCEIFRYCFKPLGQPLALLALLGGVLWWRQGRRRELALLLGPMLLALLASCLHRYPYGGARIMVFMAPALALLVAAATPAAFDWCRRRSRLLAPLLTVLLLMPLGISLYRAAVPWEEADGQGARAHVLRGYRPGDVILGNDWPHLYYFRSLGSEFRWTDQAGPLPGGTRGRIWIVYAAKQTDEERAIAARSLAPPGWHIREQKDLALTTVLLLTPEPQEAVAEVRKGSVR